MSFDLHKYNTDEAIRLSLFLRKKIDGYNKGVEYSRKKVETERQSYFEDYFETKKKPNPKVQNRLNRMNILYRLGHATEKKYLDLYKALKSRIIDLGFKFATPQDEHYAVTEVYRIYHCLNTKSDNLEIDFKNDVIKFFPEQKLNISSDNIYSLFRILESIDEQSLSIRRIPIEIDGELLTEYGADDDYNDTFAGLSQNVSAPLPEEDPSSDEESNQPIVEKKKKEEVKVNYTNQAADAELMNRIEDIKNHFREFFYKFKALIFDKEFWALFLNDIISDLKSTQTNDELYIRFLSPEYFDDPEAAQYLIKHRQEIVKYLQFITLTPMDNKKKKDNDYPGSKPSNFGVKIDGKSFQSSEYAAYEESLAGQTNYEVLALLGMDEDELKKESKLGLKKQNLPKKNEPPKDEDGLYDFVSMPPQVLATCLPMNTERKETTEYVLFDVPPPLKFGKKVPENELIPISSFEEWAQKAFIGAKYLNPIQTKVKNIAFETDENMLVCAPTGAGKTNIALMTVLHEIGKVIDKDTWKIKAGEFKIIYISPMKALAAEIVEKFSKSLGPLKVMVKELTGDMQLTKQEIQDTHVIVTTPEKWDVITRKSDGITATLKLIIMDEIHLLNDDRGPVIECIVARTLRMIERNQIPVRLLGLSATLPNPMDVAQFLRVNPDKGFFQFDQSYRPIPLHQRFIGVKEDKGFKDFKSLMSSDKDEFHLKKGKGRSQRKRIEDTMNDICYEIVRKHINEQSQVMVFVHSRKETIRYAQFLHERFKEDGEEHTLYNSIQRDQTIGRIKHKDLQKITPVGIGFHNAGVLRRDRNIVEKLFLEGNIRVLVTTATLAWGVNLPAHAVIIKGTDVYEPNKDFVDLSILDIQQIFGRAGRPQFDTSGEATLITKATKVNYYLGLMTNASEIESQFLKHLKESLNAEISLGTVSTLQEAKEWLKYTFFYIRLQRRPQVYKGTMKSKDALGRKAEIEEFLQETLINTVTQLHNLRLIRYETKSMFLNSTDLGRIASNYYIKSETMEHFSKELQIGDEKQKASAGVFLTDEKLLSIVSRSKEFENIKLRPEEQDEMNKLMRGLFLKMGNEFKPSTTDKNIDKDVNEKVYEDYEKVFALIQGYLMHCEYENSSLVADTIYIVQNCMRILRCMLEICMKKNMAHCVLRLLYWCKLIENKMMPDDHPLSQFCYENNISNYSVMKSRKEIKEGLLATDLVDRLMYTDLNKIDDVRTYESEELSAAIGLKGRGGILKKYASYIPQLNVDWNIKPIAQTILKMTVNVTMELNWTARWHHRIEPIWIIVDDEVDILHAEQLAINKKNIMDKTPMTATFFIPYRDDNNRVYRITVDSDRWIGSTYEEIIDMESIVVNQEHMEYTKLLDLQPLPKSALNNPEFEKLYRFDFFNPVQTQVFHSLYHTDHNVLIGAPTGSGKTNMAELSILRIFNKYPQKKIIYIAPLKAIAKERLNDWKERLEKGSLKKKVLELTGDFTPDIDALKKSDILITTPEKWDGISRNWQNRSYVQDVGLIVFDEIHLLGQDRGPVLEVIVSRMNYISEKTTTKIRMVGLSTALANGVDVANWFGVRPQYFFNFKPQVRPCPIEIHFEGFNEKHYCPRMATMNKPAYNAIKKFSEGKPVLIFVSSRRQTRLTALDLIALIAADMNTGQPIAQFLNMASQELDIYLDHIQDPNLKQTLAFGIGMHHAGLITEDRKIVEELFLRNKIQILIATSTLAWGVNFPAHLVIIKGTEFFDPKTKKYVDFPVVDLLQMIGRAGRPQFDTHGVACCFVEQSKKNFYRKYLNDPFPVESSLSTQITDHFNAEINAGTLKNKQDCIDYLTWTYYFRRVVKNPTYYGVKDNSHDEINKFLIDMVDTSLASLQRDNCVKVVDDFKVEPTFLGQISSFYYIKHQTSAYFSTNIKQEMSIIELIKVLSYAKEFEEIPLRHNEDNYNEMLAKICPYPTPDKNYDSSNLKTFLLFQMYFGRLPPPIRDYVTDAKLAIDGSIRIIHALMDIVADKGYLNPVINLCHMMQMLVQGMWIHDSQFKNIPHFNDQMIKTLHFEENITYLCQLMDVVKKGQFKALAEKYKFGLSESDILDIEDCVNYIPDISFKTTLTAFDSEKFEKAEGKPLEEGGEALLTVHLKRENSQYPLVVQMERYSKIKDAGWWIIVTNEKKNELICIKKIQFKDRLKREIQINLPESFAESPRIEVRLISDSYIGIDQMRSIKLKGDK